MKRVGLLALLLLAPAAFLAWPRLRRGEYAPSPADREGAFDPSTPPVLAGRADEAPLPRPLSDEEIVALSRGIETEDRAGLVARARDDARVAAALVELLRASHDDRGSAERQLRGLRKTLLELGRPSIPALVAALGDPDPEMRTRVARTLTLFGAGAAPGVPAMLLALRRKGADPYERAALLACLAAVGPAARDGLPDVLAVVRDDGAPEAEANEAAAALFAVGGGDGEEVLAAARIVLERGALEPSMAVLPALAALGSEAARILPSVLAVAEEAPDGPVLEAVLRTLAAVSPTALLRLAEEGDDTRRILAARAAQPEEGPFPPPWIRILLEVIRSNEGADRDAALRLLWGRTADPLILLPTLRTVVTDLDAGIPDSAFYVLGSMPGPNREVADLLADALGTVRRGSRLQVLRELERHMSASPERAARALRELPDDGNPAVRRTAEQLLATLSAQPAPASTK